MKWKKYTLKTLAQAEDAVIGCLLEAGIEGVEIEDKVPLTEEEKRQMFVDILPDSGEEDNTALLSFYLEEDAEADEILGRVDRELDALRQFMDIGEGSVAVSDTEDKDWINNWKEYFKQFYVDDILIVPSWEEVGEEDRDRLIVHIDPGTAFGTGKHETTQLCIRQLKKYVKDGSVMLDIGCGSGILSLLAVKFGASYAVGTELDPCAVEAAHDNMKVNGIRRQEYEILEGNIIDDPAIREKAGLERFDVAAANILAEVLVPLTPVAAQHLKKGGVYITSGIIEGKEKLVAEAIENAGMEILETTAQGEWRCITAVRR